MILLRRITMNWNCKYINNALSLRSPQSESLEIFQKICDVLSFDKIPDLDVELDNLKDMFPTLSCFERDFPSICFALATGIGKTRLMGAMIAYLHYEKRIDNFFVMAPNLTIYSKLKDDFGNISNPKYVFRGLDKFVNPPRIIDGDNYEQFSQQSLFGKVTINIFNISKLNSESKDSKGKPARIKRLNEILGESYFEYLKNLPDLCIFMDESHHYHADKSFEVINELQPILGVEVTATPQVQKGAKAIPFKNVVYEYSLAHALKDEKYIKVPAVVTRKDFKPEQYSQEDLDKEKLIDGIKLHIDTQSALDIYARTYGKPLVKPFVLVVAKDTEHSKHIKEYLTSYDFYRGYYKDKVLEINSAQRGIEKDENINQLLSLEHSDNKIEIVIHVNMLKEGWDVNNLYTIVPLRASASETLTEQTIGRGLRLPYGERTGVDKVDRLSIVSHDKYEAIVSLANDPNSLVRRIYFIDPDENPQGEQKETVELPSSYEKDLSSQSYMEQLSLLLPGLKSEYSTEVKNDIAGFVAETAMYVVQELNKRVKNIEDVKKPEYQKLAISSVIEQTQKAFPALHLNKEDIIPCIQKAVEFSSQKLTDKVIPIPQGTVQPKSEVKLRYEMFTLDTRNINFQPSEDILVGTELQDGGKTYDIDTAYANITDKDTPEDAIAKLLIIKDNIDYSQCSHVIYDLIEQLKKHLISYLHTDEDVSKVLKQRRKNLADNLYAQMNEHFYKEETIFTAAEMRPFSKIEFGFAGKISSDEIYDYRANIQPSEIKQKIFQGFQKACHTMYKFDSNTEKTFATVLENDKIVEKWLCPSIKQFNIYYDKNSNARYQPDFIVETGDMIHMVEIKDRRMLKDEVVLMKAKAGEKYCATATEFNLKNDGKPWKYSIIAHDEVRLNSSFKDLINNSVQYEQVTF